MAASIKRSDKIITYLCIAYLFLPPTANSANELPAAEDINSLGETAKLTTEVFMQESFELHMRYEFSGKFLKPEDKDSLYRLAKRAGDRLQTIAEQQKQLKQEIEDYQGNDWDSRYGSTGLWRKLSTDLYKTCMSKCEINFYLALASQQQHREQILHKILSEIDLPNQTYKQPGPKLIKAKALALLAQTDPIYEPPAIKELDALTIYSDIARPIGAAIEKIKLVGSAKPETLNTLIRALAQNRFNGDLELILKLAFLQRQHNPNGLEKTISLFPEIEDFFGSLILSDLSNRFEQGQLTKESLQQISVLEAELTADAAWRDKAQKYKVLLDYLSNTENFQTPLILYVTAVSLAESSPIKAANLLVKASKLQQQQKSKMLEMSAEDIAKQAAQLAYNLFVQNQLNYRLALEAFENYSKIANEKMDEELEYLYTIILNDSGQTEKSKQLLEKIADRPTGSWRNRAKLDRIIQKLPQTQNENQQNELLEQLQNLILTCHGQNKKNNAMRREAINIYCQLLLERQDKASSRKILNILDEAETTGGTRINLFKSKALQRLGRLDESAHYMLLAIQDDSGSLAGEVMELLSEVVDIIDELQSQADDFDKTIHDCKKLAEFSNKYTNNRQSGLLLTEISVLAADKDKEKLSETEKLLDNIARDGDTNDVDLLRCRARLLTAQGKFADAARLWAQVAKTRKSETVSTNRRSWKWWRAKFYELHCCAKISQIQKEKVSHTIEVLENSFTDIPPLWVEKLSSLKQQCRHSEKPKTQNVKL